MDGTRRQSQMGKCDFLKCQSLSRLLFVAFFFFVILPSLSTASLLRCSIQPSCSLRSSLSLPLSRSFSPLCSPGSARSRLSGKYCAVRKDDIVKRKKTRKNNEALCPRLFSSFLFPPCSSILFFFFFSRKLSRTTRKKRDTNVAGRSSIPFATRENVKKRSEASQRPRA